MTQSQVLLSGFADEAANEKLAVQQFAALAAAGLQYYSIRFIDVGNGIKNSMDLTKQELKQVVSLQADYGLSVATVGSPIGKVKLLDIDDGSSNKFIPFKQYLSKNVQHACEVANTLGTKLIRGFSFYHPIGTKPEEHLSQVCEQLGAIADTCSKHGLVFGLAIFLIASMPNMEKPQVIFIHCGDAFRDADDLYVALRRRSFNPYEAKKKWQEDLNTVCPL